MNLSTDRELLRRLWRLSWPTVLYSAFEASLGLVDLAMVRSLGPDATAAIGVSRQVTFLLDSIVLAVASGVIAVVSQAVGAQLRGEVVRVLRLCVVALPLVGLPAGLLGALASGTLLAGLNASVQTIQHAAPYLQVYFVGIVFTWANILGASFIRSTGNATTPLKIALGVASLNVPLNYLLIYGAGPLPAWGVQGAALATVGARMGGTFVYYLLLFGHSRFRHDFAPGAPTRRSADKNLPPHPTLSPANPAARGGAEGTNESVERPISTFGLSAVDWQLLGRILRIGTPMALAGLVRNGSRLVFLTIVGAGSLGMNLQAAVGVGLQVRLFSVLPALAFQVSTATLVGQAIGRGDLDEARRLGRRSVELLAMIMLVVIGLIIWFAPTLARLLIEDPTVAGAGATVLRWFAVAQFFSALNITLQGALMGAGDTLPNLRYTLFTQWILMLPMAWVTTTFVNWQLHGPLIAWTLAPALLTVLIAKRFFGKRWRS